MSEDTRKDLPPVNSPNFLEKVREALSTYLGSRGDKLDRGLTVRDLADAGIVDLRPGYTSYGGKAPISGPGASVQTAYIEDLTPPPTPSGFSVVAAISNLIITHDDPTYFVGNGHNRTLIYGVTYTSGALPVFADAVLLTEFSGKVHSYATNPATTWRLWAKWVTNDGVQSTVPAGGINGIAVTTGQDVSLLLTALTNKITASELHTGLGSRIDLIDAPSTTAGSVAARILAEADARTTAINAEIINRGTAISDEAFTRQSGDNALATSISLLTAGVAGGFDVGQSWYFDSTVESWTSAGGTQSWNAGYVDLVSTGADPQFISPAISVSGAQYSVVKARVKRLAGSGWDGQLFYATAGHTFSASFRKVIAQGTFNIGDTVVFEWDMSTLTTGGADWTSSTITQIRLDLGSTASDQFSVDWVAVGRNAPGASQAGLLNEQTARINADSAEVTARQLLSSAVLGATDPTGKTLGNITSGILFDEKSARTTADTAQVSATTALSARVDRVRTWENNAYVNGDNAALIEAVLTEADGVTPLKNGDTLLGGTSKGSISYTVESRVTATGTPTGATSVFTSTWSGTAWVWSQSVVYEAGTTSNHVRLYLSAGVPTVRLYLHTGTYNVTYNVKAKISGFSAEAAIVEEKLARATADSSEVTARQALSTALVGAVDPTGKTLANVTSGLVFDERTARSTETGSLATRATALETSVNSGTTGLSTKASIAYVDTAKSDAISASATAISALSAKINARSLGLPLEQWVLGSQSIVTLSDGKVGNSALRITGGNGYANQGTIVPIDLTKTYRVRFWARPSVTNTLGLLYFSLRQFLDGVGTPGPINGGRAPYKPGGLSPTAHNSAFGAQAWGEYSFTWSAADWQAGAKYVVPEFLDNYPAAAGYWEIQDYTFTDITEVSAAISTEASARASADSAMATSITTLQSKAGSGSNLVENSDFQIGLEGWTFVAGANTSSTFGRNQTDWTVDNGTAYIHQANALQGYYDEAFTKPIPVVVGQRYQFSVYTGSHRAASEAFMYFTDIAGANLSNTPLDMNYAEASGGLSLNGYKRLKSFGVAPSGAAYVKGVLRKSATIVGNGDSWLFFTKAMLCEATDTQTVPDGYSKGTQVSSIQTEISTRASETGNLFAKYSVKIDTNGYVSGFGLASTANNATPTSSFIIRADNFAVASPSGPGITPVTPFIVNTTPTTENGVSIPAGVYMDGAYIRNLNAAVARMGDAWIDNAKIANLDASKITTGTLSADRISADSITANKIDSRGLSIKDEFGNVLLASGSPVPTSYVTASAGWLNSNVASSNTNLLLSPNNFGLFNFSTGSVSATGLSDPQGGLLAARLTLSASSGASYDMYRQISGLTVGGTYRISLYVYLETATNLCLVANNGLWWNTGQGSQATGAGWKRLEAKITTSTGNINFHIGGHSNSDIPHQTAGTALVAYLQVVETTAVENSLVQAAADYPTANGLNPLLKGWAGPGTYPTAWANWTGVTTSVTGLTRNGAPMPGWVTGGADCGMHQALYFATVPRPMNSFFAGTFDVYYNSYTSGGSSGILVRLFTNSALTTYVDCLFAATNHATGIWQTVPFTARAPSAQIYGIQMFLMASYNGLPGGNTNCTTTFGGVTYDLYAADTDPQLLTPSIAAAATTATWSGLTGTSKPRSFVASAVNSGSSPRIAVGLWEDTTRIKASTAHWNFQLMDRTGALTAYFSWSPGDAPSLLEGITGGFSGQPAGTIVIVWTGANAFADPLTTTFMSNLYAIGASPGKLVSAWVQSTPTYSTYAMVGWVGAGIGMGLEAVSYSINSYVELPFTLQDGKLAGVNSGLSVINSSNASTYIANAAIGSAQIGSLDAGVINAGFINAARIQVGTATVATVDGCNYSVAFPAAGVAGVTLTSSNLSFTSSGGPVTITATILMECQSQDTACESVFTSSDLQIDGAPVVWPNLYQVRAGAQHKTSVVSGSGSRALAHTQPLVYRFTPSAGTHTYRIATTVTPRLANSTNSFWSTPANSGYVDQFVSMVIMENKI